MADKALKISELTAITAPSGDDILVIVDDPAGTPATKKVTGYSHMCVKLRVWRFPVNNARKVMYAANECFLTMY